MTIKQLSRSLFCSLLLALAPSLATATLPDDYVYLTFSGGNNAAPLTVNFTTPVSFHVDTSSGGGFTLAIDAFGTLAQPPILKFASSSTVAYNTSSGAFGTLNKMTGDYGINDLTNDDAFFTDNDGGALAAGTRINFLTGTFVTDSNYYYAAPADDYYRVFLTNSNGVIIGTAVAVPEPATYAAMAGVLVLAGVVTIRRRKVA